MAYFIIKYILVILNIDSEYRKMCLKLIVRTNDKKFDMSNIAINVNKYCNIEFLMNHLIKLQSNGIPDKALPKIFSEIFFLTSVEIHK